MKNLNPRLKSIVCPLIFVLFILPGGACHQGYPFPRIKIESALGNIELELYPDKAPKTVSSFLSLIDAGFFKNSSFYRVLKSEDQPSSAFKTDLIQGGVWQSNNGSSQGLQGIPHESTNITGLLHKNGVISMARNSPGSATSEFFICIGDQPAFDFGGNANTDKEGFAAFGQVINGMDVVRMIHEQPDYNGSLRPAITIDNIVRLK